MIDDHSIIFSKNEECHSLQRNGVSTTIGIDIHSEDDVGSVKGYTRIHAINSKGEVTKGFISIPTNKWYGNVIDKILEDKTLLPLLMGKHPLLDQLIEAKLKGEAKPEFLGDTSRVDRHRRIR